MNDNFGGDFRQIRNAAEELQYNLSVYNQKIDELYIIVDDISKKWTGVDSFQTYMEIQQYKPITIEIKKALEGSSSLLLDLSVNLENVREDIIDSADSLLK